MLLTKSNRFFKSYLKFWKLSPYVIVFKKGESVGRDPKGRGKPDAPF